MQFGWRPVYFCFSIYWLWIWGCLSLFRISATVPLLTDFPVFLLLIYTTPFLGFPCIQSLLAFNYSHFEPQPPIIIGIWPLLPLAENTN
jgi:hypothetical protein